MNRIFTIASLFLLLGLGLASTSSAQIKKRQPAKKTPVKTAQTDPAPATESAPSSETQTPEKKNVRPQVVSADYETGATQETQPQKKNQSPGKQKSAPTAAKESKNAFVYEFTQPDFMVSRILIEHDENGKGTITFEKKGFGGEAITDPISLTPAVVERLKNLFQTLNFLDSTEEYQSTIRQYAHLGTVKIRLKQDGRERASEFNWTENPTAKALADEYWKIGEQFVWMFDISVSLENQPLEAPGLMNRLDSLLKRNLISDPAQMLPLLKKLTDDERIPLIARNHAARIVKDIEKNLKK